MGGEVDEFLLRKRGLWKGTYSAVPQNVFSCSVKTDVTFSLERPKSVRAM